MVMKPLIVASYCKLLTSSNNNHLASTATFLRDLDTRLDSLEKEAVEQLIQQLQEVVYCLMLFTVLRFRIRGSGGFFTLDPGSGALVFPDPESRIPDPKSIYL
jgi:hypothetical protein